MTGIFPSPLLSPLFLPSHQVVGYPSKQVIHVPLSSLSLPTKFTQTVATLSAFPLSLSPISLAPAESLHTRRQRFSVCTEGRRGVVPFRSSPLPPTPVSLSKAPSPFLSSQPLCMRYFLPSLPRPLQFTAPGNLNPQLPNSGFANPHKSITKPLSLRSDYTSCALLLFLQSLPWTGASRIRITRRKKDLSAMMMTMI